MVGASSGPELTAANVGSPGPAAVGAGAVPAANYAASPGHPVRRVRPVRPVRPVGAPRRLLKASEDNLDDLFRELQMADMAAVSSAGAGAGDSPGGAPRDMAEPALGRFVPLAQIVKKGLADLRVQARRAIWQAAKRGDGVVDVDLHVDPLIPAVLDVVDELVKGTAAAARSGYLLTEPPSGEVVAFRLWAREEIVGQMRGEPATSCPSLVAAAEAPSTK